MFVSLYCYWNSSSCSAIAYEIHFPYNATESVLSILYEDSLEYFPFFSFNTMIGVGAFELFSSFLMIVFLWQVLYHKL